MQKQTPKWIEHFVTAFGPSGLVALAWWAGAFHAERIRALQQAYPILHITRDADACSNELLFNLWKLAGLDNGGSVLLEGSTPNGLARYLSGVVDRPVVIEAMSRKGEADFDRLRPCYNGGHFYPQSGTSYESGKFRGAVALVGGSGDMSASKALTSRLVHVHFSDTAHSEARANAARELDALRGADVHDFLARVRAAGDQVAFRLGHTQAYIESMREDIGDALGLREALNHAQIRCLVDLLHDLGLLPTHCLKGAHIEICEMARDHLAIPF